MKLGIGIHLMPLLRLLLQLLLCCLRWNEHRDHLCSWNFIQEHIPYCMLTVGLMKVWKSFRIKIESCSRYATDSFMFNVLNAIVWWWITHNSIHLSEVYKENEAKACIEPISLNHSVPYLYISKSVFLSR